MGVNITKRNPSTTRETAIKPRCEVIDARDSERIDSKWWPMKAKAIGAGVCQRGNC